jgi:hypothetical protein
MNRLGESYEEYEALVHSNPVGSKLDGTSEGWLRQYCWDPAAREVARTPALRSGAGDTPAVRRQRVRIERASRQWLAHAEAVLTAARLTAAMRESLVELCRQHAEFAVSYALYGAEETVGAGEPCYFIAFSTMLDRLGLKGKQSISRRLEHLERLGLIRALPRTDVIRWQATYYTLTVEGHTVLGRAVSLSSPHTVAGTPDSVRPRAVFTVTPVPGTCRLPRRGEVRAGAAIRDAIGPPASGDDPPHPAPEQRLGG